MKNLNGKLPDADHRLTNNTNFYSSHKHTATMKTSLKMIRCSITVHLRSRMQMQCSRFRIRRTRLNTSVATFIGSRVCRRMVNECRSANESGSASMQYYVIQYYIYIKVTHFLLLPINTQFSLMTNSTISLFIVVVV